MSEQVCFCLEVSGRVWALAHQAEEGFFFGAVKKYARRRR